MLEIILKKPIRADRVLKAEPPFLESVFLGIVGLIAFIYIKGGESYLTTLSDTFFFVGKINIIQYCGVLFFEGVASSLIGAFVLMQFYGDVAISHKY